MNHTQRGGLAHDMMDVYQDLDARDRSGGPLLLGVALVLIVLFAALVAYGYRQGMRDQQESLPTIFAKAEPVRVAVADEPAGGGDPAVEGAAIYRELEEPSRPAADGAGLGLGAADAGAAETEIAAAAVAPEFATAETVEASAFEPLSRPGVTIEYIDDPDALDALLAAEAAEAADAAQPEALSGAAAAAPSGSPRIDDAAQAALTPSPTPTPAPSPVPSPAATPRPAVQPVAVAAAQGGFFVQVGAFGSGDEALSAWSRFQSDMPDLAAGYGPDVQVADLGARGVFHRLRVAGFAERDAASAFCAALKQRGRDCLVKSE